MLDRSVLVFLTITCLLIQSFMHYTSMHIDSCWMYSMPTRKKCHITLLSGRYGQGLNPNPTPKPLAAAVLALMLSGLQ
jgi:hypothetical protein